MMLRKKRKNKPLNTFTTNNKLLHSINRKSTYFYKRWFSLYLLPVTCSIALLLVLGLIFNPLTPSKEKVYAAINTELADGVSISLSISNNGIEIADDGTVSTKVETGQVSYISNMIKVNTRRISKYYVGVQSASNTSNLTGASTGATIGGVGNNVNTAAFGDNTWGYVLTDNVAISDDDLSYSTLPPYNAGASPQYASAANPANGEHELKLTFAAKIRADKPADHYQTQALVSVAAEPRDAIWDELIYMQDMNPAACAGGNENGKQLIDKRDGKTYWIAKLKDDNCWMTQNLDLDLFDNGKNRTLTSDDSDIPSSMGSWTSTTGASMDAWNGGYGQDINISRYNDPGMYVYTQPTTRLSQACGTLNSANCASAGWINVANKTPSPDPTFGNDITGDFYNAHYLVGNYYTFDAATAGQSVATGANESATNRSICAKGWRLPERGSGTNPENYTYRKLLTSYGAIKSNSLLLGSQDIRLRPLYFFYSGGVGSSGQIGLGNDSNYWTTTGYEYYADTAYTMRIWSQITFNNDYRGIGYSVRCVAR